MELTNGMVNCNCEWDVQLQLLMVCSTAIGIGVFRLNPDGTPKIDPTTNQYINTYSNEDIMTFARVWTGWDLQPQRSNIMHLSETSSTNTIDPMLLKARFRDRFPKTTLLGNGHLGDGYPLCSGLPPQHYLKRGATYSYHGPVSMFGDLHDNAEKLPNIRDHFVPDATESQLYHVLCGKKEGKCSFPSTVTLAADLVCHGAVECGADTLRAVKIVDGATWGYYRCVRLVQAWDSRSLSTKCRLHVRAARPHVVCVCVGGMCM
jgi:hypothetical protein